MTLCQTILGVARDCRELLEAHAQERREAYARVADLMTTAPDEDEDLPPARSPYETGECCMGRHAHAHLTGAALHCDCPCHAALLDPDNFADAS